MAGTGNDHLRDDALLVVRDLVVEFPTARRGVVHAVSGVSFDVREGETLGIVGESGCGKSTTGRAIVQLNRPTSGTIELAGQDLGKLAGEDLRKARVALQMVFQDPVSSLNPRHDVRTILEAPLRTWKKGDRDERQKTVREALSAVGMDADVVGDRRPDQLSGGQCQRVSIARALVNRPKVVVCDEAVSALDGSVQAQILNLLIDLKSDYRLTLVFISHDLSVVRHISDRIMVMYLGKVCEVGPAVALMDRPAHPYTRALTDTVPVASARQVVREKHTMPGEMPSPIDPPSGCRVRTRCPLATARCAAEEPVLREVAPDHYVACHHPLHEGEESPIRTA